MNRVCAKCAQWRRSGKAAAGMCVRLMCVTGAADTCDKWSEK